MSTTSDKRIPRLTNEPRDNLTVFMLGVRANALLRPHLWLWVARAFNDMAEELRADPALGLLHTRTLPAMRGVAVIQYWESTEALLNYAHGPTHTAALQRFYRQNSGAVGLWHETYEVGLPQSDRSADAAGSVRRGYEALYANMPTIGLGRALGTRPVDRDTRRALDRMAVRRARTASAADAYTRTDDAPAAAVEE